MTENKKTQITPEGLEELKKELDYRKNTKKKELSKTLGEATEKGDLSENDEYNIALEDIAANELRIAELTDIIKNAIIIQSHKGNSTVDLGNTVVAEMDNGNQAKFKIVGETEANPLEKKISSTSPIGKGLMGKSVGEKVEITTPNGLHTYTIVEIE